jgi:hypothetical protein
MTEASEEARDLAAAKAAAAKLQDAAAGGTPIAIPGAVDAAPTVALEPPSAPHPTAIPESTHQPPLADADRDELRLQAGRQK